MPMFSSGGVRTEELKCAVPQRIIGAMSKSYLDCNASVEELGD